MTVDPLTKKIAECKTSKEFLEMSTANSFDTLGDFTQHSIQDLMKKPGMNYRMLVELSNILQSFNLLESLGEV